METVTKTKRCSRCKQIKSIDAFYTHNRATDGKQSNCIDCTIEYSKIYHENNKEKIKEYYKTYHMNNKTKTKGYSKEYYENHKDEFALSSARYRILNRLEHIDDIQYRLEDNKKQTERRKRRFANNVNIRINCTIRAFIWKAVQKYRADIHIKPVIHDRFMNLTGISIPDFIKYIESIWEPGMSWDNYGISNIINISIKWCIYTKVPFNTFDISDPEGNYRKGIYTAGQKECYHYINYGVKWLDKIIKLVYD
jgi:hypothetical protein